MATTDVVFNFGASDYALTDRGRTTSITYARDATDDAAKFTCTTKGMAATIEGGWGAATGVTWQTWGVPAGATVTQLQVLADWTKKLVSNTKLTANSVKIRVLAGTTTVHSAGELISLTLSTTPTDGSYVAQSAGTARAVDASYQASTTEVRLEVEQSFTTSSGSGTANVDQRYDAITIRITYTPPAAAFVGSASAAASATSALHTAKKLVGSASAAASADALLTKPAAPLVWSRVGLRRRPTRHAAINALLWR